MNRRALSRRSHGFGLLDVMLATAIMFTGAVVMITVLPKLIETSNMRSSENMAYEVATAKIDELLDTQYTRVVSAGPYGAQYLLPQMTNIAKYQWQTWVTEEAPAGYRKRVTLAVWWGTGDLRRDTYVFYVADRNND